MEFRNAELSDRQAVNEAYAKAEQMGCEYGFATTYAWAEEFDTQIAFEGGSLFVRHGNAFLFPCGGDLRADILKLADFARKQGDTLRFCAVTPEQKEELETLFPGCFAFSGVRDAFDYLYEIDRLADLSGRDLAKKRNHIKHFEAACPDWRFEPIGPDNIAECRGMDRGWYRHKLETEDPAEDAMEIEMLSGDNTALALCLKDMDALGMDGGLIRAGGRVIAITLGSVLACGSVFDVNFEKAFTDADGSYTIINREFARYIRQKHPAVRYLNREEDIGIEGLRKSKLSYHPDILLEKSMAVMQKELL